MEGQIKCRGLINYFQSPAERRAKYRVCRIMGRNVAWSITMRDWRWNKIARFFGFPNFSTLYAEVIGEPIRETEPQNFTTGMSDQKAIDILEDLLTTEPQHNPEDRRQAVLIGIRAIQAFGRVKDPGRALLVHSP